MRLDRDSPVPIAHQLFEAIRGQIERHELRPGTRLPTEVELCERLGISRTPVRRALGELTAKGLLVRYPGRGTFVAGSAAAAAALTFDRRRRLDDLTITVPDERWCWPLQRAAALWNDEHPDRRVRLSFQVVGLNQLRAKLALAVAQGNAADISLVDAAWVAEFADRGYLRSFAAIDPRVASSLADDLFPTLRVENSYHGELYALPAEADLAVLWYRKDWLASEHLAPPLTWDDLIAQAHHFQRDAVRERYGLGAFPLAFAGGVAAGETTTYQLLPLLWAAGADVIVNGAVVLNSPAARAAVEFVRAMVRVHRIASPNVVHVPWNGPALAFASGTVAFAFGGTYESGLIRAAAGWDEVTWRDRAGFVAIPASAGGVPSTLVGGMSYAIYRQSRLPALALELLVRASSADVVREFTSRTGQNPPTRSATAALDAESEPLLHAAAELIGHARARWPLVEYSRVSQQLALMVENAIVGRLTPADAVARAAVVISGITGLPETAAAP